MRKLHCGELSPFGRKEEIIEVFFCLRLFLAYKTWWVLFCLYTTHCFTDMYCAVVFASYMVSHRDITIHYTIYGSKQINFSCSTRDSYQMLKLSHRCLFVLFLLLLSCFLNCWSLTIKQLANKKKKKEDIKVSGIFKLTRKYFLLQ